MLPRIVAYPSKERRDSVEKPRVIGPAWLILGESVSHPRHCVGTSFYTYGRRNGTKGWLIFGLKRGPDG